MLQTVDKDLIYISDKLKFFERGIWDSVLPSDEAALQHAHDDPSPMEEPDDERAPGIDRLTTDDCSFEFLARTLGVGFNWAFLSEDEEEDKQFPWSLVKNIDRS